VRRKLTVLIMSFLLAVLLTGCGLKSGEELYALPEMPAEYAELQNTLQRLLDSGLEYAAPLTGANTQPVQEVDLDRDGVGEVIAFFRDSSSGESGLQVHIFARDEEEEFDTMTVINGQGLAVNSVTYAQLVEEGCEELVLSWQISPGVYSLSVYSLWQGGNQLLMEPRNYTRSAVTDLDSDGISELILFQLGLSDQSSSRAELYTEVDGAMVLAGEALLSEDLVTIERIRTSGLYDGGSALYLTGYAIDTETGAASSTTQITDILLLRNDQLVNVTRGEQSGSSTITRRRAVVPEQDINFDGILEIPVFTNLYERLPNGEICISETFYLLTWIQYDAEGSRHTQSVTYYNSADGWYLTLPEEWSTQIAVSRNDLSMGTTAERGICFYTLEKINPEENTSLRLEESSGLSLLTNIRAVPFMTIYKNTGSDQRARSRLEGRTMLMTGAENASYSVAFPENPWNSWTAEDVQSNLHIISTNWSSD